mmetsp:Transcript_86157/g.238816  ORF Transcript_86157/g.238816 Transcript_86157/m.238816 type:complete len:299 (-) Transcript_86157:506-1402(-)
MSALVIAPTRPRTCKIQHKVVTRETGARRPGKASLWHHGWVLRLLQSPARCEGQPGLRTLHLLQGRQTDISSICCDLQYTSDYPGDVQHLAIIPDRVHIRASGASKSEAELKGDHWVVLDGLFELHSMLETEWGREIATARGHWKLHQVLPSPERVIPDILLTSCHHITGREHPSSNSALSAQGQPQVQQRGGPVLVRGEPELAIAPADLCLDRAEVAVLEETLSHLVNDFASPTQPVLLTLHFTPRFHVCQGVVDDGPDLSIDCSEGFREGLTARRCALHLVQLCHSRHKNLRLCLR